jgi:Right handed beta helix region
MVDLRLGATLSLIGVVMKYTTAFAAVGLALAVTLAALPAQATNLRSYVSGNGSDANNCASNTPCRTLAYALTQTTPGGEIDILDAAGYGTLVIDRAISIVNDGVGTAGVKPPSGGFGIVINAGVNDAVSLRGLSIEGNGVGVVGIQFNTGKSLTIENCVIRHMINDGIDFNPNGASSFSMSNSLVSDNGLSGVAVAPTGSAAVIAVFNRVDVSNNAYQGIYIEGTNSTGTLKATVYNSVAANNVAVGIYAASFTGKAPTTLTVFHSVSAYNAYGILASGTGATLRADNMVATGNANGWAAQSGGVLQSYGNNAIDGNTANETAPPSVALK